MARYRMHAFTQRIRPWHVAAFATSVVVLVFLAGAAQVGLWIYYSNQPVRVADVVGARISDSSRDGRLTLRADGTAVADGFAYPDGREEITGTGTWTLPNPDDRRLRVLIDVTNPTVLVEQGREFMSFYVDLSAPGAELITYVGDPDDPRNVRVFVRP